MTEKERFLLNLVWRLSAGYGFLPPSPVGDVQVVSGKYDNSDIMPGDVVVCITSPMGGIHPFVVAVVQDVDRSTDLWTLRDIGTNETATFTNERFYKIVGITPAAESDSRA